MIGQRKSALADLRQFKQPMSGKPDIGGRASFEARPSAEHLRMTGKLRTCSKQIERIISI